MYSKEYSLKDGNIVSIDLSSVLGTYRFFNVLTVNIVNKDSFTIFYCPSFTFHYPISENSRINEDEIISLLDNNQTVLKETLSQNFAEWFDKKLARKYSKYYTGRIIKD